MGGNTTYQHDEASFRNEKPSDINFRNPVGAPGGGGLGIAGESQLAFNKG